MFSKMHTQPNHIYLIYMHAHLSVFLLRLLYLLFLLNLNNHVTLCFLKLSLNGVGGWLKLVGKCPFDPCPFKTYWIVDFT